MDLRGDTLKASSNNCSGSENPQKFKGVTPEKGHTQAKELDGSPKPPQKNLQTLQLRKNGIVKFTFTHQGLDYVKEENRTNADRRKKSYEHPSYDKKKSIEPPSYDFFCNLLSTGSHEDCSTLPDLANP